ncbi:MAG: hypothetical protein AAF218_11675 [Pseudomonadota bacterium]
MEDMNKQLTEAERQQMVYETAIESLKAEGIERERQGYAAMAIATGYGEGRLDEGFTGKMAHLAQLFCIGFACAVPPFLVWYMLL